MAEPLAPRATLPQRLLGLFILAQLFFLTAQNLLPLFPRSVPPEDEITEEVILPGRTFELDVAQDALDLAGDGLNRWAELTGQWQGWSLFAPYHAKQSIFPIVELRWDEPGDRYAPDGQRSNAPGSNRPAPIQLHSRYRPADAPHHFRPPDTLCRYFNYEFRMTLPMWFWNLEDYRCQPEGCRDVLQQRIQRRWKSIRAFLRWRMNDYLAEHSDLPLPTHVILLAETYASRKPGEAQSERHWQVWPWARWLVSEECDGFLPVEMIDPVTGDVRRIPVPEGQP